MYIGSLIRAFAAWRQYRKAVAQLSVLDDRMLRFQTDRPFEEAARLASQGLKLLTLRVEQPNLETVFLGLTGRRLRE